MIPQTKGTLPKRSLVNVTTAENGMFAIEPARIHAVESAPEFGQFH